MDGPDAVCCFWGGGAQLLRDDASASIAGRGRIRLTMNVFAAFEVLRSGAYLRRSNHLT